MEINKNSINDEIIEFLDNYEEIANLALLNFEKENNIDLNKLIKKGIEKEQKNINENNYIEDKVSKNEDEWEDFGSDAEEEEKNINVNNYQKFEDDDCLDEEKENNETNKIIDENKESDIIDNHIKKNVEIMNNKDVKINKNNDEKVIENNEGKISSNNNDNFKKKKLSNDKIREIISKIEYTPPIWARNMDDQEFINKVKLYIKYFCFK